MQSYYKRNGVVRAADENQILALGGEKSGWVKLTDAEAAEFEAKAPKPQEATTVPLTRAVQAVAPSFNPPPGWSSQTQQVFLIILR